MHSSWNTDVFNDQSLWLKPLTMSHQIVFWLVCIHPSSCASRCILYSLSYLDEFIELGEHLKEMGHGGS